MSFDLTGDDTANGFGIRGRGRIGIGGRAALVEATGGTVRVSTDSGDTTPLTGLMIFTPGIGGAAGASTEVEYEGGTAVEDLYTGVFRLRRLLGSDFVKTPEQRRKLCRGIGGWRVMLGGILVNA